MSNKSNKVDRYLFCRGVQAREGRRRRAGGVRSILGVHIYYILMGVMDIVLDMNIYIDMDKDMDIMWMKNRL